MGAVDAGVHQGQPQRWIAITAVFTLVQSGLLLSGAAVGLSLYTCVFKPSSTNAVWQAVRLYYFANVNCKSSYVVNYNNYYLDGVNNPTVRTMVILSFYTALSSILFIGSFLLLASAVKGKHMKPNTGRNLHFPWIVSIIAILLLDLIAAVLYCVDLLSTSDFSKLMGLLNIKSDGSLHELQDRSLPPVIMALLTFKGVIFWIVDVAVTFWMIKQFRKLYLLRQQFEFSRAQLASIPEYMLPAKLQNRQAASKDDAPPMEPAPILPRLTERDGKLVGEMHTPASTQGRSSALQMAARQGFSYERPPSNPWSSSAADGTIPRIPLPTTPQKYGYAGFSQDVADNWQLRPESVRDRGENDRSSNILQRDNEVFY